MNKPVAWMWSEYGCNMGVCLDQDKQIGKQEFQDYSIPLYTHPVKEQVETIEYTCPNCQTHVGLHVKHPVKELTDEEIEVLASKHLCYQIESSEVSGVFEFAKAILRKAQEK